MYQIVKRAFIPSSKTSVIMLMLMAYLCFRIEHLGLNMAMQLLVGVPLEMVHGALRIGLVYMCGVLAGESNPGGRAVCNEKMCFLGQSP